MKTNSPKVNADMEVLKSDVHRLRDDVVGVMHSAKSRSRDTVMETGDRIKGMMADLGGKAKEQFRDKSEALKDRGHETMENWRGSIEDRPMTSLIIAFAAGFIFALFFARRRY